MNGPIGVFDSGLGGLSVLRALRREMPRENFLYYGDSLRAPYGSRPTEEIRRFTMDAAARLFSRGAKALVVACNTATAAAIGNLREAYPDRIVVGIEPALKLAARRHPGETIAVMATEATLREQKFSDLLERYGGDCRILRCPCPGLVAFVERGEFTGPRVEAALKEYLGACRRDPPRAVVLGCTHFPFLSESISRVLGPETELLDGAEGTARETKHRLTEAGLLCTEGEGRVELTNSLNTEEILERARMLLNR